MALAAGAAISTARAAAPEPAAVVDTYGDIALAMYEDALTAAKELQAAVDAFLADPNDAHARRGARGLEGGARALHADARVFASATPSSTTGKAR